MASHDSSADNPRDVVVPAEQVTRLRVLLDVLNDPSLPIQDRFITQAQFIGAVEPYIYPAGQARHIAAVADTARQLGGRP